MNRECFTSLCQNIILCVGEKGFKLEAYMDAFLKGTYQMYDVYCISTDGGYIAGEVKLASTLRVLASGDALDLVIVFDIDSCHCNVLIYEVLLQWVIKMILVI